MHYEWNKHTRSREQTLNDTDASVHSQTHTHSFACTDTTKAPQIICEKYLHLSAYVSHHLSLSLSLSATHWHWGLARIVFNLVILVRTGVCELFILD